MLARELQRLRVVQRIGPTEIQLRRLSQQVAVHPCFQTMSDHSTEMCRPRPDHRLARCTRLKGDACR